MGLPRCDRPIMLRSCFAYLMGTRRKCLSVWPPYQLVTACQYPASENHMSPNKRVDRPIRVRTITVSPP